MNLMYLVLAFSLGSAITIVAISLIMVEEYPCRCRDCGGDK
jgi:ABC-type nickel/cobalt efflux system permease component RcnA